MMFGGARSGVDRYQPGGTTNGRLLDDETAAGGGVDDPGSVSVDGDTSVDVDPQQVGDVASSVDETVSTTDNSVSVDTATTAVQDSVSIDDATTTVQVSGVLESEAVQQQRREFASALESGEAFDDGEAPDALGSVDPQTDITVENDRLTIADSTRADLVESQVGRPGLNTDGVLERAASQDRIYRAVEERIETQTGTDVREGLIEDANLDVNPDGTIEADRVLLNSRRFDDFFDVGPPGDRTDVLEGANLSVDATEEFNEEIRESIAEQISERNVVDVSADQIDISDGDVSVETPSSLTIEGEEIGSDGLTDSGQADFARRQLQSIQTTEGVSVDTPVNSQAFANVSASLAQAAEGQGSLSSATRIVAASDTVSNVGDLDDLPDARIIAGLEPEQAEERLGIDASTVRSAQQDIEQRRQQLENNPGAVLESIADNSDEFINDSTRIGVAGERGQRIRQSARTQINQLEQQIAANDDDVSPSDVGLTLTDDLSGIRSIDQEGRQAIAQSVDDQLANFGAEEINVGVSGGQITTSIEDSVRERFVENAQRVEEIQARNEIADTTEGIGRRDIEVDAGEGISPSDELVTETLGTDVNGDIESFDQLEAAANIQARQQARQQAIQQVESQTIGAVDPRDVTVERTGDGFTASVSGAAAQSVDLSPDDATAVDTTVENQSPQISDPIRGFEGGLRDVGAGLDDTLGSAGRTVGSTLADINIGVQAAQEVTDSDIGDRFFAEAGAGGARALNPALFAAEGVQAGDILARGPDREFGVEDLPGAGDAAAIRAGADGDLDADLPQTSEDFVVAAGEQDAAQLSQSFERDPVGTTGQLTGGIITGSIAGTALTRGAFRVGRTDLNADARIDNRPDLGSGGRGSLFDADAVDDARDVSSPGRIQQILGDLRRDTPDLRTRVDTAESAQLGVFRDRSGDVEINDERLSQNLRQQTITRRQRELREATEQGTFEGEVDPIEGIAERARREADVGDLRDRTRQSVDVDTRNLAAEGGALGGVLADQEPEVAFDDDLGGVEPGGEVADSVGAGEQTPEVGLNNDVGSVNAGGEVADSVDTVEPEVAFDDDLGGGEPGGEVADSVEPGEPEVAFDDDVGSVNAGGELAETVDTGGVFESGIDSQFRQQIGETGEQRFFGRGRDVAAGEDIGTQLPADAGVGAGVDVGARSSVDADTGVGARPREDVDTGVGVAPRTDVDTDQRQDNDVGTPRRTDTPVDVDRRETPTPRDVDIDIPRFGTPETPRPDFPRTPGGDDPDEEQAFGLASTDDLFDSEILSGEEALEETFGSDGGRDDRFSL